MPSNLKLFFTLISEAELFGLSIFYTIFYFENGYEMVDKGLYPLFNMIMAIYSITIWSQ